MEGGQLASQAQVFSYGINYYGQKFSVSYISGLCTRSDMRNKGMASELIKDIHHRLLRHNVKVVLLIPASPEVSRFYGKRCYAVCSRRTIVPCKSGVPLSAGEKAKTVKMLDSERKLFLRHYLEQRPMGILHTGIDLDNVASVVRMSGGEAWELRNAEGKLQAMAFWEKQPDGAHILDQFGDAAARKRLISAMYTSIKAKGIDVYEHFYDRSKGKPYGMARIINLKLLLKTYAANHPDLTERFYITDDAFLPHNNGFYSIENGVCKRHSMNSYGQYIAEKEGIAYTKRSINDITALLFKDQPLQMSLMMD